MKLKDSDKTLKNYNKKIMSRIIANSIDVSKSQLNTSISKMVYSFPRANRFFSKEKPLYFFMFLFFIDVTLFIILELLH